jgi:glycosyltransferase involved in cell wall biosynthesis
MASGLVPFTNAVASVPEFVDESCAIMAPPEDFNVFADLIEFFYNNPDKFEVYSAAAAKRVRSQSSAEKIIKEELKLFHANSIN